MREEKYLVNLEEGLQEKYKKGVNYLERGRYDKGEELFIELKEEAPDFVPLYNKWAIIYIYRKDYKKAWELLLEALNLDKEFVPAITNLGNIMREEGNRQKAKEYYLKAIEIDEEYGPAYNNLGVVYREEGDINQSVKYLKKANKYHSYHVNLDNDKPFYREPGCMVPLIISILALLLLFYVMR